MEFCIKDSDYYLDIIDNKVYNRYTNEELIHNNGIYNIEISGQQISKDIIWLKHYSLLGLEFPVNDSKVLDGLTFVKIKLYGTQKIRNYDYLPVLKMPVEIILDNVIYRIIARYPKYAISKTGELIHVKTKMKVTRQYNTRIQYNFYTIFDGYLFNHSVSIMEHRLIGLAWLDNNDIENKIIVDHINGDKLDNRLENLRWVTPRENITNRNYEDNITVVLYNISTSEEMIFNSLSAVSDFLELRYKLSAMDISDITRVYTKGDNKYLMKDIYSNETWPDIDKLNLNYIKVEHDGIVKYYPNLKILADELGYKKQYLSTARLSKKYKDYNITYTRNQKLPGNFEAYNINTSEIIKSDSIINLAFRIKSSEASVYRRIKRRSNLLINGEWLVRECSDMPWPKPKNKNNTSVKIIAETTDELISFNSKKEASRHFNTCNHIINKYIYSKKPYIFQNKKYYLTLGQA